MTYRAHPYSLRQLQYAVAVADMLSFRRAAEHCHVSQPSLSSQLALLEDVLGVRLFERDRRRVLPTPAGTVVLERARELLRQADDLLLAAARAHDPLAGTLRVGVLPTVAPYLLPVIAPALRRDHPRLAVRWVEDKTDALVRSLNEGALDAVLLALEADIGDLDHAVITHDEFVLAARPDDPLVTPTEPATPEELSNAAVLLLDDGHCFRDQALSYCAVAHAHELDFRATSLTTLAQMVAGGAGVTLLPRLAVATEADRAGLGVRALAAPAPSRTLALAWRRGSPLTEAMGTLARSLRRACPGAHGDGSIAPLR